MSTRFICLQLRSNDTLLCGGYSVMTIGKGNHPEHVNVGTRGITQLQVYNCGASREWLTAAPAALYPGKKEPGSH
jgi:hypothetical protein